MSIAEKASQVMLAEVKHKVDTALAAVVWRGYGRDKEGPLALSQLLLTSSHPAARTTLTGQNLRAQGHREPETPWRPQDPSQRGTKTTQLATQEQRMRIRVVNVIRQVRKGHENL